MKKLFIFGILLLSCFMTKTLHAQVELSCPTGTTPSNSPNGQAFDPSTGKIRQWLCFNPSTGQFTFNDTVTNSSLPPNTPGIPATNGNSIFYATNYGVKAGGYKFCDASASNGSGVVTIHNDPQQGDPSLLAINITGSWFGWLSSWNCSSFQSPYGILIALGSFTVNSATQLTFGTNSSSNCPTANKCTLYLFPQDDTTAIQAWLTAGSQPGTCGDNRMWSGLAFTSAILNFASGCAANNTGNGSWPGISIHGQGINASILVVSPNLNLTNCQTASFACLFRLPQTSSNQNDLHFSDFSVDGGGQGSPINNSAGTAAFSLGPDSSAENIGIFGWGIGLGISAVGSNNAPVIIKNVQMAGVGSGGSEVFAGASTFLFGGNYFWGLGNLVTFNGNATFGCTYSSGVSYGFGLIGPMVSVPSGKCHTSEGDYFNNTPANTQDNINVAGTLHLSGSLIAIPAATSDIGLHVVSGGTAILSGNNNFALSSNAGVGIKVDAGGIVYDEGRTQNSSVTPYSISGLFIPNPTNTYDATMSKAAITGTGACAAPTTITGNIFTGSAVCPGTTGASTFIITTGITATNGWNCQGVYDRTTYAIPTALTTTTTFCTATFASVTANDVIIFKVTQF